MTICSTFVAALMVGNFRNIKSFDEILHLTIKVPATGTSQQNLSPNANFEDEDEVIFMSFKPRKIWRKCGNEKNRIQVVTLFYVIII